jgi:hypothetical protein
MIISRFCRACGKKTGHYKRVDLMGAGKWAGPVDRLLCFVASMGASEAMASRYFECEECGKVTRK